MLHIIILLMITLSKQIIVDKLYSDPPALPPLTIMDSTVAAVESFRCLGTTISQDLSGTITLLR